MSKKIYEDTKLYVKINREEIEQYLKNSHSGINSVINGNINSTHFHLMSDKDLHEHDKELITKVLKKVQDKTIEYMFEDVFYIEKFYEDINKIQKDVEDEI